MEQKIDLIIPYVNNKDTIWRNTYIDYCDKNKCAERLVDLVGARYGGIDFLDYHLKLANKNMPWINKIYLLVSNKEQLKGKKLPKNVVVVLHKDFIWQSFLPTFNSTTIEMFLWNIPNLSEYFIYANDDMLPTKPMKPSDFFENGKIKIKWRNEILQNDNSYSYQCKNNCVSLYKKFGVEYNGVTIRPVHSYTPMIKSHCKSAFDLIAEDIVPHIRAFRTNYQYNQYIYPIYERLKYGTLESDIDFLYTELKADFNLNHQICCINCELNRHYIDQFLEEIENLCK